MVFTFSMDHRSRKGCCEFTGNGTYISPGLGTETRGVALSDDLRITAQPYATLVRWDRWSLLESVRDIVAREQVALVLIGLPKRLDGSLGPMAKRGQIAGGVIRERLSLPVRMWDERFHTRPSGPCWKTTSPPEAQAGHRPHRRCLDFTGLFGFAMIILELYGSGNAVKR